MAQPSTKARERRYTDPEELRSATLAAVKEEISERMGRPCTEADFDHMVRLVGSPAGWQRAKESGELTGWKYRPRSVIADPLIFNRRMFWWGPEGATLRDRALISILAGHGVNFTALQRWDSKHAGLTVKEAIDREVNVFRLAVRRRPKR